MHLLHLGRVYKFRRGRNRTPAFANIHEQPLPLPHTYCGIGDLPIGRILTKLNSVRIFKSPLTQCFSTGSMSWVDYEAFFFFFRLFLLHKDQRLSANNRFVFTQFNANIDGHWKFAEGGPPENSLYSWSSTFYSCNFYNLTIIKRKLHSEVEDLMSHFYMRRPSCYSQHNNSICAQSNMWHTTVTLLHRLTARTVHVTYKLPRK